ncbi:hypothetical protein [Brachyspira pilosicoli]|uniref:Uncharacterized protein n=1 Tax=Brachyspira pilosicoli TaxID=52584 RepID=A0A5C8EW43_BRAPL|nr:hypothetical protein [Brachyspira pilosicoli]TXJ42135.1 hypothetical protein EPJ72_05440 [Brachyspira pilosicoli]
MASSENKKNNNKQIDIKNNDIRYIIEKYSSDIYDDYYILHSLKNIVKKINTLKEKNNNIKVLLVSINSGKHKQLKRGKYRYIEIEFYEDLSYKEIYPDDKMVHDCTDDIYLFLELYNNLKSYEQFSHTYIYEMINKIISPYKLIYKNNEERNYKDIIEDIKNNYFELIIKEREIDRLKKVMQEYFDDNNKKITNSILPSYRLNNKYKKDKKKDTRYYTLESVIVLDEILRIYKSIKSTDFVFIRNISYLDDTEEIAKEIFNFDKILSPNMYTIEAVKYVKEICLSISNDKERQKEINKINIKNIFNIFETIQMKDLENTIFYLYDTILSLIKDIRDNKNYNNIIEENEELQKGILYYDSVFYYLRYFIGYLFTDKQIINEEEYINIIELYIYKYNTLRNHNIYRFYKFYLNNETAKKYNIKDYGTINYNIYYYRDEEKIIKRYSIYDYKEIYIYYYKFILMSIAYNIVGYHRDEKYYIKTRIKIKEEREKNTGKMTFNLEIIYKEEFKKIKNDINKFNRMLNNLYFFNIIDYEEYKKYDCYKLSELINYICGLIEDEEKFISIEKNIKKLEGYKLIKKEITKIKSTVSEFEKVIEYLHNIINNFNSSKDIRIINLLNFIFYQIKDKFDDAEKNIKQFKVYKLIKKEIELNNKKLEYIRNSDNRLVSKVLDKSIYSFKEVRIMLIYS